MPFRLAQVVVRDDANGRIHRRVAELRADGKVRRFLVDERCEADQTGQYTVLGDSEPTLSEADPSALCAHCFEPADGQDP